MGDQVNLIPLNPLAWQSHPSQTGQWSDGVGIFHGTLHMQPRD